MGMGFAPTWLRQVSPPLLHKTTLTTDLTKDADYGAKLLLLNDHILQYRVAFRTNLTAIVTLPAGVA